MFFTLHSLLPTPSTFLATRTPPHLPFFPISSSSHPNPPPSQTPKPPTTTTNRRRRTTTTKKAAPLPKKAAGGAKPRRGRRSEAAAVEDYVRDTLHRTLDAIREGKGEVLEEEEEEGEGVEVEAEEGGGGVVEEDDPDWPVDAEVGWGVRASEYFEKHPIRNVVEGGVEIDWEGEVDDAWVKEINCLEWESFAFHPSPLIVLAFERYNRAAENWKVLKELEEAIKVYWCAKDRLPPRTVKIDINIEKDLAYALKALECPQLLFLKGNRILYREKEFRTADELVKMIAHFYYNAKKPAWIDEAALAPKY